MTTKSRPSLNRMGAALLLLGLVAACGTSLTEGADKSADGANLSSDASTTDTNTSADGGSPADGGNSADATAPTDVAADVPVANDAGNATDVATPKTPTVVAHTPVNGAIGVPVKWSASATFSEPMDPGSLTASTFTLTSGAAAVPVQGSVSYANGKAEFWPNAQLATNTLYTATMTTGAKSAAGIAVAAKTVWSYTTGNNVAAGVPVDLGAAGNFVILAKSAVSTVPTSAVTGDIGVSPAAATYITGFSLTAHASNMFATAAQVTGKLYAANYAVPTPANLTTAVGDMEGAFTDAAGRAPSVTELGAGNIGGKTLTAGVYKWGTGLLIPTNVTLTGSATDVWIFQIAKDLTVASGAQVILAGGALPKNVFWQVSGLVDLGTTAHFEGVILGQTKIVLHTGASINGRLLAQTAVTIDGSTVVAPAK